MPDPTYEDVYEPPLLDATFIDKIDDLIAELQNLSAPSATNVAVSPTGLHYITEDDAQGALAELDAEAYAINSSLAQSAINNITLQNATAGANQSFYYKSMGVVNVFLDLTPSTASTTLTVFTLPEGYRPIAEVRVALTEVVHDGTNMGTAFALINTDGKINIYQGSLKRVFINVCFPLAFS